MWVRPADITKWTRPLDSVWNKTPAFSGTVAHAWPKIPLKSEMKVLCIGNSLSVWNAPIDQNLSAVYQYLNPGKSIHVKLIAKGAANLNDYIAETNLGILDSIRSGRYDFLICQPWKDAMWPRSPPEYRPTNVTVDELRRDFLNACDSLYRECARVGTQMVIWSPNGSQYDDRLVYLTYSSFNCRKVANRLSIPYAFTVEEFDSLYMESENEKLVWYDDTHESVEMSAANALLLYSVMMGGVPVTGMPQNWLDVPGTNWKTIYATTPRTQFIRQDLLTKWTNRFAEVQKVFNNANVTTVSAAPVRRPQPAVCAAVQPRGSRNWDITGRRVDINSLKSPAGGVYITAGDHHGGAVTVSAALPNDKMHPRPAAAGIIR